MLDENESNERIQGGITICGRANGGYSRSTTRSWVYSNASIDAGGKIQTQTQTNPFD